MCARGNHLVRGRSSQVRGRGRRDRSTEAAQPSVIMGAHTQLSDPSLHPQAESPVTQPPHLWKASHFHEDLRGTTVLGLSHQPSG